MDEAVALILSATAPERERIQYEPKKKCCRIFSYSSMAAVDQRG